MARFIVEEKSGAAKRFKRIVWFCEDVKEARAWIEKNGKKGLDYRVKDIITNLESSIMQGGNDETLQTKGQSDRQMGGS